MPQQGGHIAIVGGGTAGWLAALVLKNGYEQQALRNSAHSVPKISVVESPNIPTVGVGEGSTSIFRQVLLDLGIDEAEFLKETGATFKFGIHHKGWRKDRGDYYGPIDDPNQLFPAPSGAKGSWIHTARIASQKPVEDIHLFTHLMRGQKSPYMMSKTGKMVHISQFHYAYHFDQAKLGKYLARKAVGVEHILAEVSGLERNSETGDVTALKLLDAEPLNVDFVIDCTGFRREIISELGGKWHSYGDFLPLNRAMPFWLDHDPEQDIPSCTLAHAQSSGWMWGIPTRDRMGCGYVYSGSHITDDQAQREIETTLGHKIEPRGVLTIDPGRQEKAWISNCVSIGLSQSFLEPLEATSIHGSLVQLILLSQTKASNLTRGAYGLARELYNDTVAGQVDDFAQFINLHYAGGREDSPFWREMTEKGITRSVRERLSVWANEPVNRGHFPNFPANLPHVEEQLHLPVLAGLGILPRGPSKAEMDAFPKVRAHARKTLLRAVPEFKSAASKAMGHRAYLDWVHAGSKITGITL